ncbi:hypothetical protein H6F42_20920 [Pseudanabaena sp. FACHB-1998]|uniref:hypothetical protein n=1 Tax=Pseudanabaena sp. FACHB-1998 TaxID=2692858 RepID=UPI00168154F1|nr:hypothetical protein [Pseudanabaena sp. FACHB-1998]MBD2179386.1 hypothetical protein [Pseudanabaena sp. FACHB-1998]
MIHHLSIAVANPFRVAKVFAELMNGQFFEFPIHQGTYISIADDAYGTAIEIMPHKAVWFAGLAEGEVKEMEQAPALHSVHAAISVPISRAKIEEIGIREGWLVRFCDRGPFQLIEFWLENNLMIELITEEMAANYLQFMRSSTYAAFLNEIKATA